MSEPIKIPYQQLSADALAGLIEEFVGREGTDYGEYEYSLNDKVEQVKRLLSTGKAVILYDPVLESTTLMMMDEFSRGSF